MYTERKRSQADSSVENVTSASGWDEAIAFTKAKIRELKTAVNGFKAAKKRGDVWPTTQSATHN